MTLGTSWKWTPQCLLSFSVGLISVVIMTSRYLHDRAGIKKCLSCWALIAHICNPSYSRGRDQEDQGLKPSQANSSKDPITKKPTTKKGWQSGSRCRPWDQTPVLQEKKKVFPLNGWITFHAVARLHYVYPSIHWWIFGPFLPCGPCE
jgi:hypothetical protein